jgi:hypothetical protein
VSRRFFGGRGIPAKDFRGGPYYAYFFGLHVAEHDHVFHTDSDMLYGGGSQVWIAEALRLLDERPSVLVCSPLPGPPTADGSPIQQAARIEAHDSPAHGFNYFTTRLFLLDRRRLVALGPLVPLLKFYGRRNRAESWLRRTSVFDLPERLISNAMAEHSLTRFDFLGTRPGMWAIHPDERSARLYDLLPELVRRVESGDVPDTQRGFYDVHESMLSSSPLSATVRERGADQTN